MKTIRLFCFFVYCFLPALITGKGIPVIKKSNDTTLKFEENKNQFDKKVLYQAEIIKGLKLFLEKNTFTYLFYNGSEIEQLHHPSANSITNPVVHFHSFKTEFINSNEDVKVTSTRKASYYKNYFIGNDASKWASNVGLYEEVSYSGLYNNVDMNLYTRNKNLEYDFIIKPGGDVNSIKIKFSGTDKLFVKDGLLKIATSLGIITEQRPVAYQIINGVRKEVKCNFILKNKILSFELPEGYDKTISLVIDPLLICSTFTGSTADNWGFTATYDFAGNIYSGGIVFDLGYPTTTGAYQTNFGGGPTATAGNPPFDISITKYDPTGSSLLFSTYLGGTGKESPSSMVVDNANNLFVLGRTFSSTFPTTTGSFDNSFNGGSDLVISKFNPSGTALLSSTFVGGSSSDGINISADYSTFTTLRFNYGDDSRGDIMTDNAGNVYVSACTVSNDFPVTTGAFQTTNHGGEDGCVFKMDNNLSGLTWSTYLGGSNNDAAYYLDIDVNQNVYVTGGTNSTDFPTTPGTLLPAYQGGLTDGFITRIANTGAGILQSTFIGTSGYDQSYFIQLDDNYDVYIYGQTQGAYPVTAGVYSNPNSGQFIHKLDPTLSATIYSTVFGSGTPSPNISPTAFLVDECQNVYCSGWGGTCIGIGHTGTTNGLPVTTNAFQNTTDGCDFYFFVLTKNAITLSYASYFGAANSAEEHVDGGTSRFDKRGVIYQSVCAGCGGNSSFPTTPTAWSTVNNSTNCNNAVIKMDFQLINLYAGASALPSETVCIGTPVSFVNSSTGALNYVWNFGDGTPTSITANPSHNYASTGTYSALLAAIDSASCNFSDTIFMTITVKPFPVVNLGGDTICAIVNMPLNAGNAGCTYLWSTGASTQNININTSGDYSVIVNNGGCTDTDTIHINVVNMVPLGNDTTLCIGSQLALTAGNPGNTYVWSTGATSENITISNSGMYWVMASSGVCSVGDTINVNFLPVPVVDLGRDSTLCPNDVLLLDAANAGLHYSWSTGDVSETITVNSTGRYWVVADNGACSDADTIDVNYIVPPHLGNDTSLCASSVMSLNAGNTGTSAHFLWSTGDTTSAITVDSMGTYWVRVAYHQCSFIDSIHIKGAMDNPPLYVPNCFTPNGNDLNDVFQPVILPDNFTSITMKIFNRWGEMLFYTEDMTKGWDGRYNNEMVDFDIYVWMIDYKTLCTGETTVRKIGHVMVLK